MVSRLLHRIPATLPDVVEASDERRTRRDRVVDAALYVIAFAISAANVIDTWELHPPRLRPVAVVATIATVVALRWRRTHPAAVGIFVGAVAVVLAPTPFVAACRAGPAPCGR